MRYRPRLQDELRGRGLELWRDEPDFSPLDFSQRYTGTFSDDGKTIAGPWEICHDGKTWEHDFDLTYTKERSGSMDEMTSSGRKGDGSNEERDGDGDAPHG